MEKIRKIIREEIDNVLSGKKNLIITIPKSIPWEEYQKELDAVKDWNRILNFKVSNFPRVQKGSKCYIVHDGKIKGWMEIVGTSEKEFDCEVTGKKWSGKFIERSGPFHPMEKEVPMKGFQGFRYINI